MSGIRRRLLYAKPKEVPNYLCFTALESGEFTFTILANLPTAYCTYVAYSINDDKHWVRLDNVNNQDVSFTTPTVNEGDKVYWKGKGTRLIGAVNSNDDNGVRFSSTCRFNASGELSSLCTEKAERETVARIRAYGNIFGNCSTLIDASELILPNFTSNGSGVFYGLFYNCTNLVGTPVLDNEILTSNCYGEMYRGCTSLITTSSLDITNLVDHCYYRMYYGCTGLTTIKNLPATTIPASAYESMFQGCVSLVNVPDIYIYQFSGDIAMRCMFSGCTSLVHCPFKSLPSTLTGGCMRELFYNCTSLLDICELPASTMTSQGYYGMLRNTKVTWIKMLATDISASNALGNWVYGVPNVNTSVFVKHIDAQWTTTGNSGVPTNWKVIYYDPALDKYYLDQQRNEECDKYGNYKAVDATTNPEAMAVIYAQGWSASPDYMTFSEASAVTDIGTYFRNAGITHFMEFIHFTGVTTIKTNAFSGNNSLVSLCIPRNVTTIQNFGIVGGPLEYLYIPSSVTTIVGTANFSNTSNVRFELHVDDLDSYVMLDIGQQLFKGTTNNPDYYFYEGETLLNSAVVLETATKIGTYAFAGYNKISSITIPNSVLTIGNNAFYTARYGFTNFIDIGSGVTSIGNQAFADVRSCPTLICRAMTAPTLGTNVFTYWGYNIPTAERKLIVPVGAVGYDTDQWKTVLQDQRGYQLIYSDEL